MRADRVDPTRYEVVLFDLDNTVSDFTSARDEAFPLLLREFGVDAGGEAGRALLTAFARGASPLWRQLERGEITLKTLNHERFRRLVEETGLDLDPALLAPAYLDLLAVSGNLIDGARECLDALGAVVRLGLVSNGYAEVQRPRLRHFDLDGIFDPIVVSGEIGVAKPSRAFFDAALAAAGDPSPSEVLVVGDSLTSDIDGGRAAGMATCWFNPHGSPVPDHHPTDRGPHHVVSALHEVVDLVLGD